MPHLLTTTALAALLTVSAAPLAAQTASAQPSRWDVYLGCWSSSSAGAIGPMICVVPTDSVHRVEFLTVDGDSVIARSSVDASGRLYAFRRGLYAFQRGSCRGFERGRWSNDSTRVFIKADYTCAQGGSVASDAVIDLTRRDAFTIVEGELGKSARQARVINFIVQLDTTVFPAEVKRRLRGFRPLEHDVTELERSAPIDIASMVEGASVLSPAVMDAWLTNRSESPVFAIADRTLQRATARERGDVRRALRSRSFGTSENPTAGSSGPWPTWGVEWGGAAPSGFMATPASVGFGLPYAGYSGGFTWGGWR